MAGGAGGGRTAAGPSGTQARRFSPREGRTFAFTLAIAFGALAALVWWRGEPGIGRVLAGVGGAFALAGLAIPGRLGPVHRAWMGLAHAISKVTTPVFMGIVYYLVVTPTGIARRHVGKNPLRHGGEGESCWAPREEPRGDLRRQF